MYDKILITGGCGAIGSEVINFLKKKYPHTQFINLDALTYAGKEENVEKPYDNYKLYIGNICDHELVNYILNKEKPKCIIHLAAETHVDNSFGNSFIFTKSNVLGTHTLLECVKEYIQKGNEFELFLHMSTDEVYGSVTENEPAKVENSFFAPSNPYAATKVGAEMICHAYQQSFNIPIIIIRANNAISKYQHIEKLIPKTIQMLKSNNKMTIHGDGLAKRTFVHAYDIASAMESIIDHGKLGSIYNIGTNMEYTVLDIVSLICKYLKPMERVEDWIDFVPDRPFQDHRYSINSDELRKLGWKEKINVEEAIKELVKNLNKKSSEV